jgi:predicted transposase/invertase (TIGR01784 family)
MTYKITPRVDIAFKKIFGVEENKDLLISLINSIVSEADQVEDVVLLNPYNPKNFRDDKLSVLDIKAMGHKGQRFNIEIQITDEGDYDKRALYYWSKLYTEQLKEGFDYSELNKTIGIHILNFLSIPDEDRYHNVFQLQEKETKLHYFKDIELHTIELNKFSKKKTKQEKFLSKTDELKLMLPKIKTALDKWVTFLTKHELLDRTSLPNELKDEQLEKALSVLEVMNLSDDEREAYDSHLKWLGVEASTIKKAEAKGKIEILEKVVKNMILKGQDLKFISEMTEVSEEEIKKLIAGLKN